MELQLKHRVELLLAEERLCLERHEKELAVRISRVLYLESVTADSKFAECTQWRIKLPVLPKWPSWKKLNKKRIRTADGDESEPKRRCSTRSKVSGIFTSGATVALIRDSFLKQKGVVVSKTAPMPEDLMNISLAEVIFTAEWVLAEILPENQRHSCRFLCRGTCRDHPRAGTREGETTHSFQIQMFEILCSWTSEEEEAN